MGGITKRTYDIQITGYYLKGVGGVEHNLLIDHALRIRGAVKNMGISLSGTAAVTSSASTQPSASESSRLVGMRGLMTDRIADWGGLIDPTI